MKLIGIECTDKQIIICVNDGTNYEFKTVHKGVDKTNKIPKELNPLSVPYKFQSLGNWKKNRRDDWTEEQFLINVQKVLSELIDDQSSVIIGCSTLYQFQGSEHYDHRIIRFLEITFHIWDMVKELKPHSLRGISLESIKINNKMVSTTSRQVLEASKKWSVSKVEWMCEYPIKKTNLVRNAHIAFLSVQYLKKTLCLNQ